MRIANDDLNFDSQDMSADIVSEPIWLGHIAYYSIQLFWTGDPDGTWTLEMSNDAGNPNAAKEEDRDFKITHWTTIGGSSSVISAEGDQGYNVENAGYRYVRVKWTASSSGTGSPTLVSARFAAKGI